MVTHPNTRLSNDRGAILLHVAFVLVTVAESGVGAGDYLA